MKKKQQYVPVIQVEEGYDVEDLLDMADSDYFDEEPIVTQEVIVQFE